MSHTTTFHYRTCYCEGIQLVVKFISSYFLKTLQRMRNLTQSELAAYSKADSIVQEVITSIRTVFAYNAQDNEVKRYVGSLFIVN